MDVQDVDSIKDADSDEEKVASSRKSSPTPPNCIQVEQNEGITSQRIAKTAESDEKKNLETEAVNSE